MILLPDFHQIWSLLTNFRKVFTVKFNETPSAETFAFPQLYESAKKRKDEYGRTQSYNQASRYFV